MTRDTTPDELGVLGTDFPCQLLLHHLGHDPQSDGHTQGEQALPAGGPCLAKVHARAPRAHDSLIASNHRHFLHLLPHRSSFPFSSHPFLQSPLALFTSTRSGTTSKNWASVVV